MPSTLTSGSINLTGRTNLDGATLTGSRTTGRARTSATPAPGSWTGDTLVARGTFISLTGGVGNDSLVGVGTSAYLQSNTNGSAKSSTLVAQGASSTLIGGAGKDSLVAAGANNFVRSNSAAGVQSTLVAQGTNVTLIGGAGRDSLVANGGNAYLRAGTGAQSLVGALSSGSVTNTTILEGNGKSTLVGRGANNIFRINNGTSSGAQANNGFTDYKTDTLSVASVAVAGNSVIQTTLDKFDLGNTLNHGAGVANIRRLTYTGTGDATLIGNLQNNYLLGGTAGNYLQAGTTGRTTLDGATARRNTLVGNGTSSMIGGLGNDIYVVSKQGDTLSDRGGIDTVSLTGSSIARYDISTSANVENIDGSAINGNLTLQGNAANNLIKGGSGNNFLGGAAGRDTLDASASSISNTLVGNNTTGSSLVGGSGTNTFYVYGGNDTIDAQGGSSNSVVTNQGTLDLSGISGNAILSTLTSSASGRVTIYTNSLGGSWIDASKSTGATIGEKTVNANAAGNTLIGGNGNDLLQLNRLLPATSIVGGRGTDTLSVLSGGQTATLESATFSGVEVLSLGSSNRVTLNSGSSFQNVILGAGPNTLDASGLTTSITLTSSVDNNGDSLVGGSGDDQVVLKGGATGLGGAIVNGGGGTNTILFNTTATTADLSSGISNIQRVSLTGGGNSIRTGAVGTVLSGSGTNSGGDTIDASAATGDVIIDASSAARGETLIGSKAGSSSLIGSRIAGNSFVLDSASYIEGATMIGGSSVDTLSINNSTGARFDIKDESLDGSRSIEVLSLTGGNINASLDGNAQAVGIRRVVFGSGPNTLDAGTYTVGITVDNTADNAADDLKTGSGNDLFLLKGGNVVNAIINADSGNDTLSFNSSATLSAAGLIGSTSPIRGVEVLSLAGGSNNISNIDGSGLTLVAGGNVGGDIIDATTSDRDILINTSGATSGNTLTASNVPSGVVSGTNVVTTLLGGRGADLLNVSTTTFLKIDSIVGGLGNDTLNFTTNGQTMADSDLNRVQGVEVLRTANGNNSLTLSSQAQRVGLSTIIGGTGNDIFTQEATNSNAVTFVGGNGNDLFRIANVTRLTANSIAGGSGSDTIELTAIGQTVTDTAFAKVTSVEAFRTSNGNNSVTVTTNAINAGLQSITGGAGSDTITQTALAARALTLDGGDGNDYFNIATKAILVADSIIGGFGTDTLRITQAEPLLDDSSFRRVSGVEALQLTSTSSVTLGSAAETAGFRAIYGGTGGDSMTHLFTDTALSLIGGAGNDYFVSDRTGATATTFDSIAGGVGTDSLQLKTATGVISDDSLTGITGVEALILASGDNAVLDANAAKAGFNTVYLNTDTAGSVALDASSSAFTGSLVIDANNLGTGSSANLTGSNKADSFLFDSYDALAASNLVGGGGTDTLKLSGGITYQDEAFLTVNDIEVLQSSGGDNSFVIGSNFMGSGIQSLIGGTGNDTVDLSNDLGGATNVISYDMSAATGVNGYTILSTQENLPTTNIIGGAGANKLILTDNASDADAVTTIDDALFAGLSKASIGTLDVTGNIGHNSLTLATNAVVAGVSTVLLGANGDTLDAQGFIDKDLNPAALVVTGGAGDDLVVTSLDGASSVTFSGNGGNDSLLVTDGSGSLTFAVGSAFENLLLGDNDQTLNLTGAAHRGFSSIYLGSGANKVDAGGLTGTTGITFYGTDKALTDTLTGAGGSVESTFIVTNNAEISINDQFSNFINIDKLDFTNAGSVNIALGSSAASAGINTLVGSGGDDTLNASNIATDTTLTGGAGADRFILSSQQEKGAFITDFNSSEGDAIQLDGSKSDYFTHTTGAGATAVTGIYNDSNANGVFENGTDKLIANLNGVASFDLNDSNLVKFSV